MRRKEIRRQQGSESDLPSRHWGVPPAHLAPVVFVSNGLFLANAAINFSSSIQHEVGWLLRFVASPALFVLGIAFCGALEAGLIW